MNPSAKLSTRTDHVRAIERRSKRARAATFKALGLNSRGREYKRAPRLSPEARQAANLEKWRGLAHRRLLLGQTSRGTRRVYLIILPAADFSVIQSEIDLLGRSLAGLYESLPPKVQAQAVQVATAISNLKLRIQTVRPKEFQKS